MPEFCTRCGAPYDEDDRFCGKCGAPRPGEAPAPRRPRPTAAASSTGSNRAAAVVAVGLMAVIPAVVMMALGDCGSSEGQFIVSGGPHGEWRFVTTGCASMQPFGQMGANLHADGHNDGAVYVTLDHSRGYNVELEVPGSCRNADGTDCTVFPVPREQCTRYDVHLKHTGTVVNDVRLVEGHVDVECALTDGTQVVGRIVFDGC